MWMTRPMLLSVFVAVIKETRAAPLPTGGRLRDLAGKFHRNFRIGYASSTGFWSFPDAFDYKQVAAREFNILTPINDMKMETIQPQRGVFNFSRADRHVDFAQAHNMTVCGHTLIWHSQNPDWLTLRNWSSTELLNIMETHITTVVGHWNPGDIAVWHVTNEILTYDGSYRNTIWYSTLNETYVPSALVAARAADPLSKLILNDYGMESVNAKSDGYYALAKNLQINGIPLDGIGFQAHLTVDEGIDGASFRANMQRFSDLNLEIYITELDVRIPDSGNSRQVARQSEIYHQVISACLEQPACKALQTWGFTDKYSWIPDHDPGYGRALIFDETYNAKEPYYELQTALSKSFIPVEECPLVPECCEEDCCGKGTSWDPPFCVYDPSALGFNGTHSDAYDPGCVERVCCEADCCSPGTRYDGSRAFCLPGEPTPEPTPAPA